MQCKFHGTFITVQYLQFHRSYFNSEQVAAWLLPSARYHPDRYPLFQSPRYSSIAVLHVSMGVLARTSVIAIHVCMHYVHYEFAAMKSCLITHSCSSGLSCSQYRYCSFHACMVVLKYRYRSVPSALVHHAPWCTAILQCCQYSEYTCTYTCAVYRYDTYTRTLADHCHGLAADIPVALCRREY